VRLFAICLLSRPDSKSGDKVRIVRCIFIEMHIIRRDDVQKVALRGGDSESKSWGEQNPPPLRPLGTQPGWRTSPDRLRTQEQSGYTIRLA
jgi:hypothetical protein